MISGKNILIISPQQWQGLMISKQHYAVELARHNTVYYLQPPNVGTGPGFEVKTLKEGVRLINHSLFFPYKLLFHWRSLYNWLMGFHIKRLLIKINVTFDICWSFDGHVYHDLKKFNAVTSIYHPVDLTDTPNQLKIANSADIIFSVADNILDTMNSVSPPRYFINHGLCEEFANQQALTYTKPSKIKVGYIGNIGIPSLDRATILRIVKEHREIEFVFIGNREKSGISEIDNFINELESYSNVSLFHSMNKKDLKAALKDIDVFLLCYDSNIDVNAGSNSHKLLEYLSFGKAIIANRVSTYVQHYPETLEYIEMMPDMTNEFYPEAFRKLIDNLDEANSLELREKRIAFANQFTYVRQIDKIEKQLLENNLIK